MCLKHHCTWNRMHYHPFEWKSIEAGLVNHLHHIQSLSSTTREQSLNALSPKMSDLREGMSSHHSLQDEITLQLQWCVIETVITNSQPLQSRIHTQVKCRHIWKQACTTSNDQVRHIIRTTKNVLTILVWKEWIERSNVYSWERDEVSTSSNCDVILVLECPWKIHISETRHV